MRLPILSMLALAVLAACTELPPVANVPSGGQAAPGVDELPNRAATQQAFIQVARAVEPMAEQECRRRARDLNCDFDIRVDARRGQPANAYQTLDKETGRPLIVFTSALLNRARNADEIAFVMSHEAAHHIERHIARGQQNARVGETLFGALASEFGASDAQIREAQRFGQFVGVRSYSKEFELEADALGTVIAARAGYSPVRGAEFFNRIPDPGDRFLGSHPPNAERIATVRRVAAGL